MPRFKDQAVCIRHLDWSETSQIVVLLTAEHGKLRGLAKGSKRTSPSSVARFSGGIELLTRGQVVGVIKTTTDLATITEWDLQEPWRHLHTDLEAQRLGLYAADVGNALLADHDPHPKSYEELSIFLDAIAENAKRQAALLRFQWRLLEELGYKPRIEADARTGEALPEDQATYTFDARAGGLTSQPVGFPGAGTSIGGAGPWRVRRETVEVLRAAAGGEFSRVGDETASGGANSGGAGVGTTRLARANRLLCVYIRAILDRQLPTMEFVLSGGE